MGVGVVTWGVQLIFDHTSNLQTSFYFLKFFHLPYGRAVESKDTDSIDYYISNSKPYADKFFLPFLISASDIYPQVDSRFTKFWNSFYCHPSNKSH